MSLRHLFAASHAGVETLGDDIGQAIVDDDLDFDVRILPQQLREFRPEDRVGRIVCGRDPNGAGRLFPKFAQSRKLSLDLLEPRANGVKQAFARLRWGDAACGAGQQPKTEPFLEATNGVAKRGLRNAQLRCGLRETALLPDSQKGQQVVQISAVHLCRRLISLCKL
jgi:hypothetical protein